MANLNLLASDDINMNLMGLDIGTNKIGVAISNSKAQMAIAHIVIRRTKLKDDMQSLLEVIQSNDIQAIVIGVPLNMDGSKGKIYQKIMAFAWQLTQELIEWHTQNILSSNIEIYHCDERLSSRAVQGKNDGYKYINKNIDAQAAAFVLQNALDQARNRTAATNVAL